MSVRAEGGNAESGSGTKKPQFTPTPAPLAVSPPTGGATSPSRGVWFMQPGSNRYVGSSIPNPTYAYYQPSDLAAAYKLLPPGQQAFYNVVAAATSNRATGSGLFDDVLQEAERRNLYGDNRVGPMEIAAEIARKQGIIDDDGQYTKKGLALLARETSDDDGSGRYDGPVSRVTLQAESDIESTANALALEMLGRTLNNDEIARVTKRIRTAEYAQPDVTTPTGPGGTVAQQGLTAEGRQQILRDVISQNPEFEQFQVDSTVMDATLDYIKKKRAVVDV